MLKSKFETKKELQTLQPLNNENQNQTYSHHHYQQQQPQQKKKKKKKKKKQKHAKVYFAKQKLTS